LLLPDQFACGLIQRDHPVLRHVGEHFAFAHRNSAAKLGTVAWIEGPLDPAGLSIDGENFALGRLDVENSIYSHGSCLLELLGRSTLEVVVPGAAQCSDVALIHLGEGRIILVAEISPDLWEVLHRRLAAGLGMGLRDQPNS
jgi:hypothetical protein